MAKRQANKVGKGTMTYITPETTMTARIQTKGKTSLTIFMSVYMMATVTLVGVGTPQPVEADVLRGAMGGALLGGLIGGGDGAAIGALGGAIIGGAREDQRRDANARRSYRAQSSLDMERRQLENERMNLARERQRIRAERRM